MKNIPFALLFLVLISCSKKDKTGVEDKELPSSIRAQITNAEKECPVCGIIIFKYFYNQKVVYGNVCNGPLCNCYMVFYDQEGELIEYDEAMYKDINAKKVLIKEVYHCTE